MEKKFKCGCLYDYDDGEFKLICSQHRREIEDKVEQYQIDVEDDILHKDLEKNEQFNSENR